MLPMRERAERLCLMVAALSATEGVLFRDISSTLKIDATVFFSLFVTALVQVNVALQDIGSPRESPNH